MLTPDDLEIKTVPGWPRYSVSKNGMVFGHRGLLKQKVNASGYHVVTLRDNGRSWDVKVARLVLEAFVGPASGRLVRHLDDEKTNNKLENLAYGTVKDNSEDARRNGKMCLGEKHGMAILTVELVKTIRSLKKSGLTYREIENEIGVKKSLAWHVVTRRLWKHVD